ncbi:MAG TPA: hypothetical protein VGJ84_05320 [Polyangiaceae bacterium]
MRSNDPLANAPWIRPPPKPGSSITHTKMCTCLQCPERNCCSGEAASGGDGADAGDATLGLSVASCTGRCTRHVWRVKLKESCDAHMPAECCPEQ